MPFSGILPCREYFGATRKGYRQLRTPVTLMPFCTIVTVVMISYDAKFHDGVLILSTEPAMPFSGILPCREHFGATHEGYRQLRTLVTLVPFCRLVTIAKDHLWLKFHIGILILSY